VRRVPEAAVLAIGLSTAGARAETCGKPDLLYTFPPSRAEDVPSSGIDEAGAPIATEISAKYAASAVYIDEPVLFGPIDPGVPLEDIADDALDPTEVVFNENERILQLALGDTAVLAPGRYAVKWPALRGDSTGGRGRGANVEFTVASALDTEAPEFEGLRKVEWDVDRQRDDCTDSLEERFVFDIEVGSVTDDSPRSSLRLRLFDSSAGRDPPPLAVLPMPEPGETVRFRRAIDEGDGRLCFRAKVVDLARHASGDGDQDVCATTTAPPFFYGCGMVPRSRAPGSAWFGALGLLALCTRRRHRPAP
jgi:hypothetical protein